MKPLMILLLLAGSLQAQSIADVAKKERDRQAKAKPARVITATESKGEAPKPVAPAPGTTPEEQAKADTKVAPTPAQPAKPATPDPVEVWNNQVNQLRTKVRTLQDQELTLQLQLNQANNQVYAPVTDQATQERALALVAQIQKALAEAAKQLDDTKKTLDAMLLQGPPKK